MRKLLITILALSLFSTLFAECNKAGCSKSDCSVGKVDVSGQIRYRFEWEGKDFNSDTDSHNASWLRTRLNLGFKPSYDTGVFIQLQDARILGSERNPDTTMQYTNVTLTDGSADAFDLHQGYFYLHSLFGLCLDMKMGRMEVALGPERIVGPVGWHNFGRSFDGLLFNYYWLFGDVKIFNFKEIDPDQGSGVDKDLLGAHISFFTPENFNFQAFLLDEVRYEWNRYTLGFYGKAKLHGFYTEVEFASQFGEDEAGNSDFGGMMYALNLGYNLNPFVISGGIDYLSGDDTDDDKDETFFNGYGTNHKYYGFMDQYLINPSWGLQDIHIKFGGPDPMGLGINAKLAYHMFTSAVDDVTTGESDLGSELDLILSHQYNKNTTFSGGYCMYMPGDFKPMDAFGTAGDGVNWGDDTAIWWYFTTIVNF